MPGHGAQVPGGLPACADIERRWLRAFGSSPASLAMGFKGNYQLPGLSFHLIRTPPAPSIFAPHLAMVRQVRNQPTSVKHLGSGRYAGFCVSDGSNSVRFQDIALYIDEHRHQGVAARANEKAKGGSEHLIRRPEASARLHRIN